MLLWVQQQPNLRNIKILQCHLQLHGCTLRSGNTFAYFFPQWDFSLIFSVQYVIQGTAKLLWEARIQEHKNTRIQENKNIGWSLTLSKKAVLEQYPKFTFLKSIDPPIIWCNLKESHRTKVNVSNFIQVKYECKIFPQFLCCENRQTDRHRTAFLEFRSTRVNE